MNFKRIGRMFLCLLLVCCLLLQTSPIKAHATGFEGILGGMTAPLPAPIVIGSILIGLGITAVETGVFEELVGFVEDKLEAAGEVVNGMIDTWVVSDGETETYTVSEELIQGTLEGVWDSGMIISSPSINGSTVPAGQPVFGAQGVECISVPVDSVVYFWQPGSDAYYGDIVLVSSIPFEAGSRVYSSGSTYSVSPRTLTVDSVTYYYVNATIQLTGAEKVSAFSGSFVSAAELQKALTGELEVSSTITAVEGLEVGQMASKDKIDEIYTVYPGWSMNVLYKSDDSGKGEKIPYWPIAPTDNIYDLMEKSQEDVWNGLHDYNTTVLSNWDILLNTLTGIKNFIKSLLNVQTWIQAVVDAIDLAKETVVECFEFLTEGVQNILDFLKDISLSIFKPVLDALKDAFLVRDGYFESKISNLRQKYSFVDSILGFCLGIRDVCLGIGSEPPILYIDLAAAEGSVNWGQRVVFVDLTWYSRYKPYGDAIISAFLWAMFSWRVLHMIPGLINGTTGIVGSFRFRHGGGD